MSITPTGHSLPVPVKPSIHNEEPADDNMEIRHGDLNGRRVRQHPRSGSGKTLGDFIQATNEANPNKAVEICGAFFPRGVSDPNHRLR